MSPEQSQPHASGLPPEARPTCRGILRIVSEISGRTFGDLLGPCRKAAVARPRMVACYLMHELRPDLSLAQIGLAVGGRDTTTIRQACKRVKSWLDHNPEIQWLYGEAKERLVT